MRKIFIGILAVTLIIVIGMLVYTYNCDRKVDNDDCLDIKDDVKDSNGNIVAQFDREFYNLEDISKGYASSKTLKNTAVYNYDLDGDGVEDRISFYKKSDFSYAIELNGTEVLENEYNPKIYIVDLNESDDTIEVLVFDEGPSWDLHYIIYSKRGNNLEAIYDKRGDSLKCDKEGIVLIDDSSFGSFTPELYFEYVYLNNGVVDNKEIDLETISDVEFKNNKFYFSKDYDNKDKIDEIDYNPTRLSEIDVEQLSDDISFRILDVEYVDNNGFKDKKIKVELTDGRVGYIFMLYFAG